MRSRAALGGYCFAQAALVTDDNVCLERCNTNLLVAEFSAARWLLQCTQKYCVQKRKAVGCRRSWRENMSEIVLGRHASVFVPLYVHGMDIHPHR